MQQENKTVKELDLTLTLDDINLILTGLGELPAKLSISLIDKIRSQASRQLAEPTEIKSE